MLRPGSQKGFAESADQYSRAAAHFVSKNAKLAGTSQHRSCQIHVFTDLIKVENDVEKKDFAKFAAELTAHYCKVPLKKELSGNPQNEVKTGMRPAPLNS